MRWEVDGKKIESCTLIKMSWGGQLPMEIIDSCNRRDKDSYGESIDDSPIVKAPTSIPVAGTRESAKLEELSVRRLSLMRNAQAYDCERLGYRFVKRCFDIVFSAAVITVAFVPSLVLCAAIAIESPGCPLYRQKRVGRFGKPIYIFKFRSMFSDAHSQPDLYLNEEQLVQWKREQKVDHDPRVTRIGRFIRKASLDEIPQFLNVLLGDMSVVGPRPVTLKETYEFGEDRDEVLSVRPGITGLWQSTDRNEATWANGRRQLLELQYVRNCGFSMDACCLFRTFGVMFGVNKTGR